MEVNSQIIFFYFAMRKATNNVSVSVVTPKKYNTIQYNKTQYNNLTVRTWDNNNLNKYK